MVLWYMLLLTVTLLAFSSILYGSFNKLLYDDLDDLLISRAEGVANSIDAYWSAKAKLQATRAVPDHADFANNAAEWVETKRKDPELMSIFVRILDRKGQPVVTSKTMPRIGLPDEDVLQDALDGEVDLILCHLTPRVSVDHKPMPRFRVGRA